MSDWKKDIRKATLEMMNADRSRQAGQELSSKALTEAMEEEEFEVEVTWNLEGVAHVRLTHAGSMRYDWYMSLNVDPVVSVAENLISAKAQLRGFLMSFGSSERLEDV